MICLGRRKKELVGRDEDGFLVYRDFGQEGMTEDEVVPLAAQVCALQHEREHWPMRRTHSLPAHARARARTLGAGRCASTHTLAALTSPPVRAIACERG